MKNRQSEGSALVVVLGILSVMMLMAIAFSMFTRTERSGTTNLKNSFVARQSLQTALSRALEAVDLSFDNPSNNWAVPVWREPYLASSSEASNDYFNSRQLDNDENAEAKILNAEMAACLTPAQLALVRSADVQWAPIYASIGAKGRVHGTSSGIYGEVTFSAEGEIYADNAAIESCAINSARCDCRLTDCTVKGSLIVSAGEGGLTLENTFATHISARIKRGNVGAARLNCRDTIFETDEGNVTAEIAGDEGDFDVIVDAKEGTCNRESANIEGNTASFKAYSAKGNIFVDFVSGEGN